MKVALVMAVISDLGGSGGAERLFSHLHEFFTTASNVHDVCLITSSASVRQLQAAGRLQSPRSMIVLELGARPGRGKIGIAWMTIRLLWTTLMQRFDVVHICLPTPVYVPYLAALSRMPRRWRPKLTLTVIDCTLAHSLEHAPASGTYERQVLDAHLMYMRWTRLDGIYSWYRAFVDVVSRHSTIAGRPLLRAARFCFTDLRRFAPAAQKENIVVFAGRLSEQKRPLLFVDAVARLRARTPELIDGWRFEMYGTGALEAEVRARIAARDLGSLVTLTHAVDMAPVFARTRLFVSPQAFENFTSLSMLEAMASGNAVIAENVGQTGDFVQHGANGLLVDDPSADGFAAAMADYLRHPQWHAPMAAASRALAVDVHSIEHFAEDILAFWRDVLRDSPGR